MTDQETLTTHLWWEEAAPDNPFQASTVRCAGYDVFGDLVTKASWPEYLYLLFQQERPSEQQCKALQILGIALANPGIRDYSVRAAMNGGVGGSTSASCLMAALAVGAGQYGGAREAFLSAELWTSCSDSLERWRTQLASPPAHWHEDFWPKVEHLPGFNPDANERGKPLNQLLEALAFLDTPCVQFLRQDIIALESLADLPLAISGLTAAVFTDLGFTPEQTEMLYLLMRLPGAAAHALEQRKIGWQHYPFFSQGLKLENDPGPFTYQEKPQ